MKKITVILLALVVVMGISGSAGAVETNSITGLVGPNYFGGSAVVDINQDLQNIVIGGAMAKVETLESAIGERENTFEFFAGKHWDKVRIGEGGGITDKINYEVGAGFNNSAGILFFGNTTYEIDEQLSVGVHTTSKTGLAFSVNYKL